MCGIAGTGSDAILNELLAKRLAQVNSVRTETEIPAAEAFLRRYADVPISLANACLVRMSELYPDLPLLRPE